jgi:hypothetical protein
MQGDWTVICVRGHRGLTTSRADSLTTGAFLQADLEYGVAPRNRDEACAAARIHHLAGCMFASRYYPFSRIG